MDINTGVGRGWAGRKISVTAYAGRRIELTIFQPVNCAGGCNWVGVSLSPRQAIAVANRLLRPLKPEFVAYADPAPPPADQGEIRHMWKVFKVKHTNQVLDSYIAIGNGKLAINQLGAAKITDYFCYERMEELDNSEVKRLAGILYHWAGAKLVGYVKRKRVVTQTVLDLEDRKVPQFLGDM